MFDHSKQDETSRTTEEGRRVGWRAFGVRMGALEGSTVVAQSRERDFDKNVVRAGPERRTRRRFL